MLNRTIHKCFKILNVQLLLKSLNSPIDQLCQLHQSISLMLRLYLCSTSTILTASVQTFRRCKSEFLTMKESLTKKNYGITLSKHETIFHTCIQTFEQQLYFSC